MSFRVVPASVPASADEWRRAMSAPLSELPSLTENQLAEVKQFSLKEEEYKRLRVLLRQYAEERQSKQGLQLGKIVESIIAPLVGQYSLACVSRRGTPSGWRVTIQTDRKGIFEFQCPLEDVDALTAGRVSKEELEAFRDQILVELGKAATLGATG
jgi:hypothetical protein